MNYPKTNPLNTPMTNQVLTTCEITRDTVLDIVQEFHEDAEVVGMHINESGISERWGHEVPGEAWVRIRGWWEDDDDRSQSRFDSFWVYVTNDRVGWPLMCMAAKQERENG